MGKDRGHAGRVSLDPGYEDQGQMGQGLVVPRCVGKWCLLGFEA